MNQENRSKLSIIIAATARYYSRQIDKEIVSMMLDDLSDLEYESVARAYSEYRKNPKNRTFPMPAQIREVVSPEVTPEAKAREIIDRIKKAIDRIGYARESEAEKSIGPIGWQLIKGMGGWTRVCESDFIFNHGLIAQVRNRAEDLFKYGDNENFYKPFEIENKNNQRMQLIDLTVERTKQINALQELQTQKPKTVNFEIPPDDERKKMIADMIASRSLIKEIH